MDLNLKGKTALVTGASIGIGRGIALALAREGARLAIVARRANLLEELAGEIVAAGGTKPVLVVEDLVQEGAPARIAKAALDGLGSVDILINNAGGSRPFKIDATEEQWQEAMTLNFTRQRQLTHALLDQMTAEEMGPDRQHHRQVGARGHQRRLLRQGGDPRLGQGPLARGRQARHHRQLHPARAHRFRADPPQLHARVPAMAGRQRDPRRPLRRARGRRRPGLFPGLTAGRLHHRHRHPRRRRPAAVSVLRSARDAISPCRRRRGSRGSSWRSRPSG